MVASLRGREPGSTGAQRNEDKDREHLVLTSQRFVNCSHEFYKSPINPLTNLNTVHNY
jgi:hypothetical protein